jgi:hypothetical protein
MFKELIQKFNDAPLYYGIMFGPFLLLCSFLAYDAIYMLLLELWCIAYGLIY